MGRTDCPGLQDRALLDRAEADGWIVLTLDKDFWQPALQRRIPLNPATPGNLEPLVDAALRVEHSWAGHVSVVTTDGIEMIPVRGQ